MFFVPHFRVGRFCIFMPREIGSIIAPAYHHYPIYIKGVYPLARNTSLMVKPVYPVHVYVRKILINQLLMLNFTFVYQYLEKKVKPNYNTCKFTIFISNTPSYHGTFKPWINQFILEGILFSDTKPFVPYGKKKRCRL